jgi:hypothetical protein
MDIGLVYYKVHGKSFRFDIEWEILLPAWKNWVCPSVLEIGDLGLGAYLIW